MPLAQKHAQFWFEEQFPLNWPVGTYLGHYLTIKIEMVPVCVCVCVWLYVSFFSPQMCYLAALNFDEVSIK